MKSLAVPILLCSTVALASPGSEGPVLRVGRPQQPPDTSTAPPAQPPPQQPNLPTIAPPPPAGPMPFSAMPMPKPASVTDENVEPDKPGWTGILVGFGYGTWRPPAVNSHLVVKPGEQDPRNYVALGMEIHWVRPVGLVRPGVLLRPDILWIDGNEEVARAKAPRYDLSALASATIGDKLFGRIGVGPLMSYGVTFPGVDRLRGGLVAEANIGWHRLIGIYAEARKTWGTNVDDLAYTAGLRIDLAVLSKLN